MPNRQIQISIVDTDWPKLKIIVNSDGRTIRTESAQWDVALSQFTPPVNDALRFAVEEVLKQHKVR
jgi:hypothetical protein